MCEFCLLRDNEVSITWEPEAIYYHAGDMACPFQICLKLLIASSVGLNTSEKSMHVFLALCQPEPCCVFLVHFMVFINFSGCFLLDYCQCLAFFKTVSSQSAKHIRLRQPKAGPTLEVSDERHKALVTVYHGKCKNVGCNTPICISLIRVLVLSYIHITIVSIIDFSGTCEVAHLEQNSVLVVSEVRRSWKNFRCNNKIQQSKSASMDDSVSVHLWFVRKRQPFGSRKEEEKFHLYKDC